MTNITLQKILFLTSPNETCTVEQFTWMTEHVKRWFSWRGDPYNSSAGWRYWCSSWWWFEPPSVCRPAQSWIWPFHSTPRHLESEISDGGTATCKSRSKVLQKCTSILTMDCWGTATCKNRCKVLQKCTSLLWIVKLMH